MDRCREFAGKHADGSLRLFKGENSLYAGLAPFKTERNHLNFSLINNACAYLFGYLGAKLEQTG